MKKLIEALVLSTAITALDGCNTPESPKELPKIVEVRKNTQEKTVKAVSSAKVRVRTPEEEKAYQEEIKKRDKQIEHEQEEMKRIEEKDNAENDNFFKPYMPEVKRLYDGLSRLPDIKKEDTYIAGSHELTIGRHKEADWWYITISKIGENKLSTLEVRLTIMTATRTMGASPRRIPNEKDFIFELRVDEGSNKNTVFFAKEYNGKPTYDGQANKKLTKEHFAAVVEKILAVINSPQLETNSSYYQRKFGQKNKNHSKVHKK